MRGKHRCSVLDDNGKQCRKSGTVVDSYHGDPEFAPRWATWVRVWWCAYHDPNRGGLRRQIAAPIPTTDACREGEEE